MDQDKYIQSGDSSAPTKLYLYLVVQANDEAAVKSILVSPATTQDQLNTRDTTTGWTPLFIACVGGFAPIVRLLLAAGAKQDLVDSAG